MGRALLLVDDDEANTQILSLIFEDEGLRTDTAATGDEALRRLGEKKYDLIILDYVLPDIKGHDLAAEIQEKDRDAKIILLTGYSKTSEARPKSVKYSAVLLKPISPEELVAEVKKALGAEPSQTLC
jgi:CheY-like chemotaxis protein